MRTLRRIRKNGSNGTTGHFRFAGRGLVCLLCLVMLPLMVRAAVEGGATEPVTPEPPRELTREELEALLAFPRDDFVYLRENRPDPFMPFVSEAVVEAEIKEAAEELTGMRKFEPGQLTLVAIVMSGADSLAMVQDSTGRGYVVRKGTKIGRTGEVVDIVQNKVILQQESYAAAPDEKRHKSVEMVLKKEGDKNP